MADTKNGCAAWFVLNHVPTTAFRQHGAAVSVEKFNKAYGFRLELFAPTFVRMTESHGKLRRVESPLLFHYVFVRGEIDEVRALCRHTDGFSFILDRDSATGYLMIAPEAVASFRLIALRYENRVPCFATDEIELEKGDLVEVVQGDFPGLRGVYVPRKRGRTGHILIEVSRHLAAVVYDIRVDYLRVLEFAPGSRRPYDQIDAILPRLYAALRQYAAGRPLDAGTASALHVFCRRFEVVRPGNAKLYAKLQLILMTAFRLLGDEAGFVRARAAYAKNESAVTNPATLALALLCRSVVESDPSLLAEGCRQLAAATESKAKRLLGAEYEWHALEKI